MNEYLAWEALRFCFGEVASTIGGIVLSRVCSSSPPSASPFPLPLRATNTVFGGQEGRRLQHCNRKRRCVLEFAERIKKSSKGRCEISDKKANRVNFRLVYFSLGQFSYTTDACMSKHLCEVKRGAKRSGKWVVGEVGR